MTPIARAVQEDSMLIKHHPPSGLLTFLLTSWYNVRMNDPSFQNKDKAMQMLKAKLFLMKQQENQEKIQDQR